MDAPQTLDAPRVTPEQVAKAIGKSPNTTRQYMRAGVIRSTRIGRSWRTR